MIIKLVITVFIIFVVSRISLRFKKNDITLREFLIWLLFWVLVAAAAWVPKRTDAIAQFLGVERGADLLVYVSIIVLFFIVFKLLTKIEKIDRDVTKIVREIALRDDQKKDE